MSSKMKISLRKYHREKEGEARYQRSGSGAPDHEPWEFLGSLSFLDTVWTYQTRRVVQSSEWRNIGSQAATVRWRDQATRKKDALLNHPANNEWRDQVMFIWDTCRGHVSKSLCVMLQAYEVDEFCGTSPLSSCSFETFEEVEVTTPNEEIVVLPPDWSDGASESEGRSQTPSSRVSDMWRRNARGTPQLERAFNENTNRVLAAIRQSLMEAPEGNKDILEQTDCLKCKYRRNSYD